MMREGSRLSLKHKKALLEYQRSLVSRFPKRVERLILFGSRVRGDSSRDSDTDVLVVVDRDNRKMHREIVALSMDAIVKYMVDISPLVVEEREFREWSPLMEHVKSEGIELWSRKRRRNLLS
ncbi:nucleotidyltransferase domain-containing protein [bacterium]|nr:nucleotidyltransferase domain-containing protein [bacterium]